MDKNLKKAKYQELFLSELRNNHLAEKKIEESIREMETKENMKKLANALRGIWKKTDENVKDLEKAFLKPDIENAVVQEQVINEEENLSIVNEQVRKESRTIHLKAETSPKDFLAPVKLPAYQILTYDNLVELVDNLSIEQITQILESSSSADISNHYYLTKVAEKLVKERDSKA
jgi:ferritin-like metal-binding protein YciE